MIGMARMGLALLLAGWLADRLASTDADVEAGIDAFEAGEHDTALGHYDAAVARLGERAEISFDRGLALLAKGDTEAAKTAFQRASEAEALDVRASAFYQLGNLAFEAETWDVAIAAYTDCLKARPDHANAKWNLELALLRKQKQEEDEDKDEDSSSSDDGGSEGGSEDGGSEDGGSGGQDDQKQDDQKQDDQKQDDQKQDDQKQDDQKQDDQKQDDQKQDDQRQDDQKQDDQKQDEQEQDEQEQPQPAQIDRADLERALEQLDEQDQYPLDRPRGRLAPPAKDW